MTDVFQAQDVEVMLRLKDEGWEIWVLNCDAGLKSCRYNLAHDPLICAKCAANVLKMATMDAKVPGERILTMDVALTPKSLPAPPPATLDELLRWTYEGVNVGRGVASTLISAYRDSNLDLTGRHRELIATELCAAIGAARNYRRTLDRLRPDRVVIYNGRHNHAFPMVDLCEKTGVSYWCHEQGARIGYYQLFKERLPHSVVEKQRLIARDWDQDPEKGREAAIAWYEARRRGRQQGSLVFTDRQKANSLPTGFDPNRHNVVIFNSSEDEMKTIIEWDHDLYVDQNDAIRQILAIVADRKDIQVYLRVHPNLNTIDNADTRALYATVQDNFHLIPPEDEVDTYALMTAADVVVTFGSTTGIEATYWGRPSVLYGRSFYEGMGAVYEPGDRSALAELLLNQELTPKARERTFPYGAFVATNGYPFQHFTVRSDRRVLREGHLTSKYNRFTLPRLLRFATGWPGFVRKYHLLSGRYPKLRHLGAPFGRHFSQR